MVGNWVSVGPGVGRVHADSRKPLKSLELGNHIEVFRKTLMVDYRQFHESTLDNARFSENYCCSDRSSRLL